MRFPHWAQTYLDDEVETFIRAPQLQKRRPVNAGEEVAAEGAGAVSFARTAFTAFQSSAETMGGHWMKSHSSCGFSIRFPELSSVVLLTA